MRISIPLTGTVKELNPLRGEPSDPVRPIDINLGNVSWTMVDVDLENNLMIIEVEPGNRVSEPDLDGEGKQKIGKEGNPIYITRKATEEEKTGFLQYAQDLIEGHTKDELYAISRCPRLKKPAKGE